MISRFLFSNQWHGLCICRIMKSTTHFIGCLWLLLLQMITLVLEIFIRFDVFIQQEIDKNIIIFIILAPVSSGQRLFRLVFETQLEVGITDTSRKRQCLWLGRSVVRSTSKAPFKKGKLIIWGSLLSFKGLDMDPTTQPHEWLATSCLVWCFFSSANLSGLCPHSTLSSFSSSLCLKHFLKKVGQVQCPPNMIIYPRETY